MSIEPDNTHMNLHRIKAVVIHHSATPRSATFESIKQYHVRDKGWTDIGYHYVILADGTLRYGRILPRMGAHALGRNADTVGVCLVGDNTIPSEAWAPEQIHTLRRLLEALRMVFPDIILLRHADAYAHHKTECPGISDKTLKELLRDGR